MGNIYHTSLIKLHVTSIRSTYASKFFALEDHVLLQEFGKFLPNSFIKLRVTSLRSVDGCRINI